MELASQMGGTPVTIWEDREYWGETNAMLYLRDRITENGMRCFALQPHPAQHRSLRQAISATLRRHRARESIDETLRLAVGHFELTIAYLEEVSTTCGSGWVTPSHP